MTEIFHVFCEGDLIDFRDLKLLLRLSMILRRLFHIILCFVGFIYTHSTIMLLSTKLIP